MRLRVLRLATSRGVVAVRRGPALLSLPVLSRQPLGGTRDVERLEACEGSPPVVSRSFVGDDATCAGATAAVSFSRGRWPTDTR